MYDNGTEEKKDKVVIVLNGDLIASAVTEARGQFKKVLADGTAAVTVDLSRVAMVDSQGIGALVALHNSLTKVGGSLTVINASTDLVELFRSMRLDRHFVITEQQV